MRRMGALFISRAKTSRFLWAMRCRRSGAPSSENVFLQALQRQRGVPALVLPKRAYSPVSVTGEPKLSHSSLGQEGRAAAHVRTEALELLDDGRVAPDGHVGLADPALHQRGRVLAVARVVARLGWSAGCAALAMQRLRDAEGGTLDRLAEVDLDAGGRGGKPIARRRNLRQKNAL